MHFGSKALGWSEERFKNRFRVSILGPPGGLWRTGRFQVPGMAQK
ncbi:hypothetical protein D1BOALGB6SA_10127 [Olavius sp. associated proteobacterium Delta 1]|nr:hypothetical protein D1BOALGB6SA_10127 [Olavius sp. associated proteobacterium Delta 1]